MGALHQVNASYYSDTSFVAVPANGHPSDTWGGAVGAGIKILTPFIGTGDYFQAQVNYAQGASRYVFFTPNSNWGMVKGNSQSFGVMTDAVYGGTNAGGNTTSAELTTAWGVNAAYEHFWSPRWKTSAYGGYAAVSYGGLANAMLCNAENGAGALGSNAVAIPGCDNDWSTYWIGSRTQWNLDSSTYLALDVLYQRQQSAETGLPGNLIPTNVRITSSSCVVGTCTVDDMDNWSFRFRVHRDFYP
jgi:hypothetical protein